ncbi:MAG: thioredoxin [Myxococcota bacterium]|nr:thioredoxin [Myxococcota bacterium]
MASESLVNFEENNFDSEVLNSEIPVLVDFWAPWCAPCRAIAPSVEALADEYAGKVKVGKLNIDDNPTIPGKYGIRSIPTLLVFKGGDVVDQQVGGVNKAAIEGMIKKAL